MTEHDSTVASKTIEFFQSGYHCAEALVAAVLDQLGEETQKAIAHATAFGGGIGRSFGDTCGALSGALIVIGHLYGRNEPGANWDYPAHLGADLRELFIKRHGTTHCGTLRESFGEERQLQECQKLTGNLATILTKLLADNPKLPT